MIPKKRTASDVEEVVVVYFKVLS